MEVPYPDDIAQRFAPLAQQPWAMLLDSCASGGERGRYSMIVAEPVYRLWREGGQTWVAGPDDVARVHPGEALTTLRQLLSRLPVPEKRPSDLPFVGGAVGYLAYDFGLELQGIGHHGGGSLPEISLGIYDGAYVVDHERRQAWLTSLDSTARSRERWSHRVDHFSRPPAESASVPPFRLREPVQARWSWADYAAAFARVQDYIHAGDCYQVNLAQAFSAACTGHPWSLYRDLREVNAAPFAAYLALPQGAILSLSPERLLTLRDSRMEARPIKGTRPRLPDPEADLRMIEALLHSPKDRAENIMIVDLLRNDLGRVAAIGSVTVPELCRLESFAHVHHLVSSVRAQLAPGADAISALQAVFPGGSITGAPKHRAMEIIAELEAGPRGMYCGSIGYMDVAGTMDMNIAIRSLTVANGCVTFWAGGGIVADSRAAAEYQECLDKVAPFHAVLSGKTTLAAETDGSRSRNLTLSHEQVSQ
ncbi:aminodeoxychorismate synthase component I [Acidithiobacillus sp.]